MATRLADLLPMAAIQAEAQAQRLDPLLVAAVVYVESGGNRMATRYEPAYQWTFRVAECAAACGVDQETELRWQMTSWGLMQVMGAVAREQGLAQPIPSLLDSALGLKHGCRLLAHKLARWDVESSVAAYNAGSPRRGPDGKFVNQGYVARVMAAYLELSQPVH